MKLYPTNTRIRGVRWYPKFRVASGTTAKLFCVNVPMFDPCTASSPPGTCAVAPFARISV